MFVGLIAFAVIFTSCPSAVSNNPSSTKPINVTFKVMNNGFNGKLSDIFNFENVSDSIKNFNLNKADNTEVLLLKNAKINDVNGKKFTFNKPIDELTKLGFSYQSYTTYVIDTIDVSSKKYNISINIVPYKIEDKKLIEKKLLLQKIVK